ncbi:MAG: GTPase Era [Acidiferrobacterales bacterium]
MEQEYRSGYVAIVGKPNVGKSTLMNHLIGQKISITSRKPQTTRHQILGLLTNENCQFVFVDTPGLHTGKGKTLNRFMNRAARGSLSDVDCILFVVSADEPWGDQEANILKYIEKENVPVILVVNKIDRLPTPDDLLPIIEKLNSQYSFKEIVPVSALKGTQLTQLQESVRQCLPIQERLFPEDQVTDKSERFIVAEILREQVFRQVGQEVPYSVAIDIEQFKEGPRRVEIHAVIYVEKPGQKAIIIGKGGARIKSIGGTAREEMEKFLQKKVHLETWVKVKEKWSDDARILQSLGYGDLKK